MKMESAPTRIIVLQRLEITVLIRLLKQDNADKETGQQLPPVVIITCFWAECVKQTSLILVMVGPFIVEPSVMYGQELPMLATGVRLKQVLGVWQVMEPTCAMVPISKVRGVMSGFRDITARLVLLPAQ